MYFFRADLYSFNAWRLCVTLLRMQLLQYRLRPSLRARQIPNSEIERSCMQMGQCFTWEVTNVSSFIYRTPTNRNCSAIRSPKNTSPRSGSMKLSDWIFFLRVIIWRRSPNRGAIRLDCLAQLSFVAPTHLTWDWLTSEGFRAIARNKIWERVNLPTKSKIKSLIKTVNGNQPLQRGNRIIVIETFFATPFSDLIRTKINCTKHMLQTNFFGSQTTL